MEEYGTIDMLLGASSAMIAATRDRLGTNAEAAEERSF